ncbi:MAG: cytochrome c3 family protein [SAR324 cluster bacterium]|nr:cytochrome c3 family protein [SAR324 cluster bacterium]
MNHNRRERSLARWKVKFWAGYVLLAGALAILSTGILSTPVSAQQKLLTNADVAKIDAGTEDIRQPIKFSHKIHATDNQIDCQYCHIYARRSFPAGAPPVAICAGCHKFVGKDLDEVKKVMGYWERKEAIPWVKIHDVPDYVRFPHYKHINAKNEKYQNGVPCKDCHGDIGAMDVVKKQFDDFGLMGWCLKCHLTIKGTFEQKRAIASVANPRKLKYAKHPSGNYDRPRLTDCLTCHY